MKRLHTPLDVKQWLEEISTFSNEQRTGESTRGQLRTDSRQVQAGDVFMAYPGKSHDARQFVQTVLDQGARACLVQGDDDAVSSNAMWMSAWGKDPRVALYPHLKAERGLLASAYYECPSEHIKVSAITGTNGKTTCAWWLTQALAQLGCKSAMAGTLGQGVFKLASQTIEPVESLKAASSPLTTMEAVELQQHLRAWADHGVTHLCIEASSIGLQEGRMQGTHIEVAVFTNFTQDHLDYHLSMDAYWAAKEILFDRMRPRVSVINLDDERGRALYARHKESRKGVLGYSCDVKRHKDADLGARNIRTVTGRQALIGDVFSKAALSFDVVYQGRSHAFVLGVLGDFNVSNFLAVLGSLLALGHPLEAAMNACAKLTPPPGRMQTLGLAHAPMVVIDYAHTPDAIEKALLSLKTLTHELGGQLWCVMGCGGDRDPSKRALMGAKVEALADRVMLTSDNPRNEDPVRIIAQIKEGFQKKLTPMVRVDRSEAIVQAIEEASINDVILIAGKGHESYQEIQGVRRAFSDQGVALEALKNKSQAASKGVAHVN